MGFLPQTKCSRCDRTFSGLRARCPYCGARRSSRGKRVTDTDNSTWKLVIGILLMVVLIAAVIVLLVTADDRSADGGSASSGGTIASGDNVSSVDGTNPGDEPDAGSDITAPDDGGDVTEPDTGNDEPVVDDEPIILSAEKVTITYLNREVSDFTMKATEDIQLGYKTVPEGVESTAVWESSDSKVFVVLQSGLVTAIGKGNATLTVTVDGVSASCIVRVK